MHLKIEIDSDSNKVDISKFNKREDIFPWARESAKRRRYEVVLLMRDSKY